jgi:PAS domain S-box-containing protein
LVSDGEINRRLQGAALNAAAQATLESALSVIVVLGLSAVTFVGLAALAAWNFARLTRQRAAATDALAEANRELQTLSAVASRTRNLVIITDAQGRIEWVNQAFSAITGYSAQEAIGRRPGDLLQGAGSDREIRHYMAERIAAGLDFSAEILNYAKDGRTYWIAIEAQPVTDETGRVAHFVAIETDVTARKQTEAALRTALDQERETRELKSRFITMTSHEFRTPLTTILTTADFLKLADADLTSTQRADRLDKIEWAARHISQLMDDMLHYDRADSAWLQFAPQPVDLGGLVR